MATFTAEQVKTIQEVAAKVTEHATYQAERFDSLDNPAFCACEIIDLVEWMTPEVNMQSAVAKVVLESYDWPEGTVKPVKSHFGLPY